MGVPDGSQTPPHPICWSDLGEPKRNITPDIRILIGHQKFLKFPGDSCTATNEKKTALKYNDQVIELHAMENMKLQKLWSSGCSPPMA